MRAYIFIIVIFLSIGVGTVFASETSGTIVTGGSEGYAWSNQAGWVNFGCTNCGVLVTDNGITGYAWNDNYGWINLNPANGGVSVASDGSLSGYGWGEGTGWIDFSGTSINSSGVFTGTASGSTIGTLTFDCTNCSVRTDYVPQDYRSTTVVTTSSGNTSGNRRGSTVSTTTEPFAPEVILQETPSGGVGTVHVPDNPTTTSSVSDVKNSKGVESSVATKDTQAEGVAVASVTECWQWTFFSVSWCWYWWVLLLIFIFFTLLILREMLRGNRENKRLYLSK